MTMGGLRAFVGDLRQLASVRRIVLDDGPEAGVRALAFSTGGGLDFWVLTDRSFDLGPVWFRGVRRRGKARPDSGALRCTTPRKTGAAASTAASRAFS
jgi:pimeloyl-ACP methyl ester carboxylesterase